MVNKEIRIILIVIFLVSLPAIFLILPIGQKLFCKILEPSATLVNQSVTPTSQVILPTSTSIIPTPVISIDAAYTDIMDYLDAQVNAAEISRQNYWKDRDLSTVQNYEKSIEPYRQDLIKLIEVPDECLRGITPKLTSSRFIKQIDNIDIYAWTLSVCDGHLDLQALVDIPKNQNYPLPAIIVFHGTSGTVERTMGLDTTDDYHHHFGFRLAKNGYMVIAPVVITQPTIKLPDGQYSDPNEFRNELDDRALSLGTRLVGIEIGQTASLIDYLSSDKRIDTQNLGVYGISLGGFIAFLTGAIDTRIQATVVSNYIEDRVAKLTSTDYPSPYWLMPTADYAFIPDILLYFTDTDIASLILPRKLFIEVGIKDPRAEPSKIVFEEIKLLQQQLKLPDETVGLDIGNNDHEIYLNGSLKFLNSWLKK
jgi:hypothetical protein